MIAIAGADGENVRPKPRNPKNSHVMKLSTAIVGQELHVVIIDDGGNLRHSIRTANGAWTNWGRIIPPDGHQFESVSASAENGALHVVMKNVNGVYFHDIRASGGKWQGTAQLPCQPLLEE